MSRAVCSGTGKSPATFRRNIRPAVSAARRRAENADLIIDIPCTAKTRSEQPGEFVPPNVVWPTVSNYLLQSIKFKTKIF